MMNVIYIILIVVIGWTAIFFMARLAFPEWFQAQDDPTNNHDSYDDDWDD